MKRPYMLVERTQGPYDSYFRPSFCLLQMLPAEKGYWRVLYCKNKLEDQWKPFPNKTTYHVRACKPGKFSEIRKTILLTKDEFFAELL